MINKYSQAILWPVNRRLSGPDMPPEEANIELHRKFANSKGAVYWDVSRRINRIKGPIDGYLYITAPVRMVLYKCEVTHVISREELKAIKQEWQFIPEWRSQCFMGRFKNGRKHKPSKTWIKMTKIKKLTEPLELNKFRKRNGTPIKNTHSGFVYVMAPK